MRALIVYTQQAVYTSPRGIDRNPAASAQLLPLRLRRVSVGHNKTRMPVLAASPPAEDKKYQNVISDTSDRRSSMPTGTIDSLGLSISILQ